MSNAADEQVDYRTRLHELLKNDFRLLIGGELLPAASGKTMATTSPFDGSHLAEVPIAGKQDVDRAFDAARSALPDWRNTPLNRRVALVRQFAERLRERAGDFGILDAADGGNPVTAMIGDARMAADWLEHFAGIAFEVKGETLPSMTESWLMTKREPYGVVGRIVAFNHPILFAASKIGPPVLMGNTLLLKAPDQAPLSTLLMAEIVNEIFPPGVINLLSGTGAETGDALVRHPGIKRMSLVGSVETGRRVQATAAEVGVKQVSLELGGKNAMIVCPDADLDKVVEGAANGMNCHWSQGQSCGSISRLFLHDDIHDEILARLVERLGRIVIGDPLAAETQMGCLVSKKHYEKVTGYVDAGKQDGARLVTGGGRPEGDEFAAGFFLRPTVFADVDMSMRIAREEIFGPVLSVLRWSDLDDAVAKANSLSLGLTGAVWTKDIKTALTVADKLDTGYVWINGTGTHFLGAPFSGHRNSGTDSEESIEELQSYTQVKTVNIAF